MNAAITSESVLINNKEYTVVGVEASSNSFGLCDTTIQRDKGIRETFYVGNEPLLNIVQKSINDDYSNKIISQVSTLDRCGDFSRRVAVSLDDYFFNNKNIITALHPLLEYIKSGMYVIYEAKMIPTDGAGNYFWSSYMVPHEFTGSGTFNSVCKKQHSLIPSFLVPTDNIGSFSDKLMKISMERVKKDNCAYGVCFHLSGMFCALLSNHYDVTAALLQDKKIKCIVIEPIRHICTAEEMKSYSTVSQPAPDNVAQEGEDAAAQNNEEQPQAEPQQESETNFESCIYSCPVKIPFSRIPNHILETLFLTRKQEITKYTDTVTANCERPTHAKSKRSMPANVLEKCERYPDCEMLQSAALVGHLSDDELNALLLGETTINGKYIINKNYYSSITIALNYLQYKDFNRFLNFASALLKNEDLTAIHQYTATRLGSIMDKRIDGIFREILNSDNDTYNILKPSADKYIKRFKAYTEAAALREKEERRRKTASANAKLTRDVSTELDSLDLASKLKI